MIFCKKSLPNNSYSISEDFFYSSRDAIHAAVVRFSFISFCTKNTAFCSKRAHKDDKCTSALHLLMQAFRVKHSFDFDKCTYFSSKMHVGVSLVFVLTFATGAQCCGWYIKIKFVELVYFQVLPS